MNWTLRKLSKHQVAELIEDFVNNPGVPRKILCLKYGVSEQTAANLITDVYFGGKVKDSPISITIQSKINETEEII